MGNVQLSTNTLEDIKKAVLDIPVVKFLWDGSTQNIKQVMVSDQEMYIVDSTPSAWLAVSLSESDSLKVTLSADLDGIGQVFISKTQAHTNCNLLGFLSVYPHSNHDKLADYREQGIVLPDEFIEGIVTIITSQAIDYLKALQERYGCFPLYVHPVPKCDFCENHPSFQIEGIYCCDSHVSHVLDTVFFERGNFENYEDVFRKEVEIEVSKVMPQEYYKPLDL
ncbi:MAG: hypothetical protein D6816_02465 [Bacteroidetes bacterium]|nr:MAG: hypothetical protein D6816_02465 [Bacteroidota bacterium]